eukprot:scaffold644_cov32-Attheya_sp.AAC.2
MRHKPILQRGFRSMSDAGFECIVGAINGMLLWTTKPMRKECREMSSTFFCNRKKKYGLNFQAIDSGLPADLENDESLLLPGHTITGDGDNAYVKKLYMATPILGASPGVEYAYNFFHSQLRITVERAFGILVHRCWGILRKALSCSASRVGPLVMCLCRLHNFCVNENSSKTSPKPSHRDEAHILRTSRKRNMMNNLVHFDPETGGPRELLGGGHHLRDLSSSGRNSEGENEKTPMDDMIDLVRERGLSHPLITRNKI